MTTSLRERLLSRAVINWETGCWEWTGSKNADGYGRIKAGKEARYAHRVAYEMTNGPIPNELQIDHLCCVRHCINPAHLEPVTARENTLRALNTVPTVLAARTHCKNGHEFTPENTSRSSSTRGRRCRACRREWARKHYTAS